MDKERPQWEAISPESPVTNCLVEALRLEDGVSYQIWVERQYSVKDLMMGGVRQKEQRPPRDREDDVKAAATCILGWPVTGPPGVVQDLPGVCSKEGFHTEDVCTTAAAPGQDTRGVHGHGHSCTDYLITSQSGQGLVTFPTIKQRRSQNS